MKYWSDLEVDQLIDEISEAAYEAIEQAAGEAARAAALAAVEREAVLIREVQRWRVEADTQLQAKQAAEKKNVKNIVITAVIGLLGGLAVGVGGTLIMRGAR